LEGERIWVEWREVGEMEDGGIEGAKLERSKCRVLEHFNLRFFTTHGPCRLPATWMVMMVLMSHQPQSTVINFSISHEA